MYEQDSYYESNQYFDHFCARLRILGFYAENVDVTLPVDAMNVRMSKKKSIQTLVKNNHITLKQLGDHVRIYVTHEGLEYFKVYDKFVRL